MSVSDGNELVSGVDGKTDECVQGGDTDGVEKVDDHLEEDDCDQEGGHDGFDG